MSTIRSYSEFWIHLRCFRRAETFHNEQSISASHPPILDVLHPADFLRLTRILLVIYDKVNKLVLRIVKIKIPLYQHCSSWSEFYTYKMSKARPIYYYVDHSILEASTCSLEASKCSLEECIHIIHSSREHVDDSGIE